MGGYYVIPWLSYVTDFLWITGLHYHLTNLSNPFYRFLRHFPTQVHPPCSPVKYAPPCIEHTCQLSWQIQETPGKKGEISQKRWKIWDVHLINQMLVDARQS